MTAVLAGATIGAAISVVGGLANGQIHSFSEGLAAAGTGALGGAATAIGGLSGGLVGGAFLGALGWGFVGALLDAYGVLGDDVGAAGGIFKHKKRLNDALNCK